MRITSYCLVISVMFSFMNILRADADRRCHFYDLSKIPKHQRVARSPIIQFYSSNDNIGNYLPILGIQHMLGIETDLWCMHDKHIDFNFINKNYKGAIIGGAGLLHQCFERFWKKLDNHCTLPMIMWGLGVCLPYKNKAHGVSKKIVQSVARKCDLINVRDKLTAKYYQLNTADISPCPTVAWLEQFKPLVKPTKLKLYSAHAPSVGKEKTQKIIEGLERKISNIKIIDNIQVPEFGLVDYIQEYYCKASLIITSRLHGAIVAYGLGIPCIMISGDAKLDSFYDTYGFGHQLKNADQCVKLCKKKKISLGKPLDLKSVHAFGEQALEWLKGLQ